MSVWLMNSEISHSHAMTQVALSMYTWINILNFLLVLAVVVAIHQKATQHICIHLMGVLIISTAIPVVIQCIGLMLPFIGLPGSLK